MKIFQEFIRLTEEKNIPFTVNFELTYRCNLRCRHCYLPKTQISPSPSPLPSGERIKVRGVGEELTTEEVKDILDQLAEAGSLWLVFTGGEVFLREDFFEIAQYARKKSFCLTIFTNGTLIDSEKALRLAELTPYQVQISLYGAKAETHDYITRVRGSFLRTLQAIRLLRKLKVKVVLKTPLMKKNFPEYEEIIRLNEELGTNWQMDPWITPKNDGDRTPLTFRTLPEQMKELFFAEKFFPKEKFEPGKKEQFICSAGKNLVAISPWGDVYPCLMWLVRVGNLRKQKFSNLWNNSQELTSIRRTEFNNLHRCSTCSLVSYCVRCPGLADLEDGDALGPSSIACQTAEIVKERVSSEAGK